MRNLNSTTDFLINCFYFVKSKIKITRKDIYFGLFLIVLAYFLNKVVLYLDGYFTIQIPVNQNKNAFYYKKTYMGNVLLFFKQTPFSKEFYYLIRDNSGKIISKGLCVLPSNYYNSKVTFLIKDDVLKCLFKEDYLVKKYNEELFKNLENYKLKNKGKNVQ